MHKLAWSMTILVGFILSCGSGGGGPGGVPGEPIEPPSPVCAAGQDGSSTVAAPELMTEISDRWHEAWSGSPAVADLDGDGTMEIIAPRENRLYVWHLDGEVVFRGDTQGRIWAPPVVADLVPDRAGLEIAVASRGSIYAWDAQGEALPGFPVEWQDEMRSLAAADIDGDGRLELVTATTNQISAGNLRDSILAINANGSIVSGFPPNSTGASGCDDNCYVTGSYDQNIALGDLDGDRVADIFVPHDNAYVSIHDGTGRAFDAADVFSNRTKVLGVRFMTDYANAHQGYSDNEDDNQGHFTNSAPAIADLDGDGTPELLVVGSVQNVAQSDRKRGVALWVINSDGSRPDAWVEPYHVPDYLAGLEDFSGTNVVGLNNEVVVVDLDPDLSGPEILFADYGGRIHALGASSEELWTYRYTSDARVLTGGMVVADLSRDGRPEVVFSTYSPDNDKSHLIILDAGGNELHKLPLPQRGAMPVPTIADTDGDGQLEIVVSLKGNETDGDPQIQVYTVPSAGTNCMPWPEKRGNLRRDGYLPPE